MFLANLHHILSTSFVPERQNTDKDKVEPHYINLKQKYNFFTFPMGIFWGIVNKSC